MIDNSQQPIMSETLYEKQEVKMDLGRHLPFRIYNNNFCLHISRDNPVKSRQFYGARWRL